MTTAFDTFAMRESVRAVQRFMAAPAWSEYGLTPFPPMVSASADNATVDAYVKATALTIFHPSGSAAMSSALGGLGTGVVNPDLTVKGADGLRIADASVWVGTILNASEIPALSVCIRCSRFILARTLKAPCTFWQKEQRTS